MKGDFKDDDDNYLDRVGEIVGGLKLPEDVTDIIADGKNVAKGKPKATISSFAFIITSILARTPGRLLSVKTDD